MVPGRSIRRSGSERSLHDRCRVGDHPPALSSPLSSSSQLFLVPALVTESFFVLHPGGDTVIYSSMTQNIPPLVVSFLLFHLHKQQPDQEDEKQTKNKRQNPLKSSHIIPALNLSHRKSLKVLYLLNINFFFHSYCRETFTYP